MEDTGLYVIGLATPKESKAELGLVGWLHADYVHNVRTFQSHKNQIPNFREFGTFPDSRNPDSRSSWTSL